MPTESADPTPSMQLETTSEREQLPPPWFAELTLLARWFSHHLVLIPLCSTLLLARRVDASAAVDVVLLMLAAHVGNSALNHARRALRPVERVLPHLWGRRAMVSTSAASRFLKALDADAMDAMQTLFCPPSATSASAASAQGA